MLKKPSVSTTESTAPLLSPDSEDYYDDQRYSGQDCEAYDDQCYTGLEKPIDSLVLSRGRFSPGELS